MKAELEVDKLILEMIGRVAGEIGTILYSLQIENEFTDDKLALELGIDIGEIRKALFAMYEIGLAEYKRKRDDETGWIEYYWKINYDRAKIVLKKELEKTKRRLEEKIKFESSNIFYVCPKYCVKVSYNDAIELNFSCPKCGSMLEYLDCIEVINNLRREIEKIDATIKIL